MRLSWFVAILVTFIFLNACRPNVLERALQGQLPPAESNKVITEYCHGCHIHHALDPIDHVQRIRLLYARHPYTATTQCRACHLVEEDTWNVRHRKTIFPADVVHNRYAAHERHFLKDNPELAQGSK